MSSLYSIEVQSIVGQVYPLADYSGKVLLIVNTASRCGFTPQFAGLQQLYEKYAEQGLVILGFPCNQFRQQEPDEEAVIAEQCQLNFGVTFPLHAKIDVNGPHSHQLYRHLTSKARGLFGIRRIKWNFTKFLIDRNGNIVRRFGPTVTPERLEKHIQALL